MQPELIADYNCDTGEGPLWHPMEKRVYWLDITNPRMFWYDPATGHHEQFEVGRQVGGFTIQADGSLLLFMDRGGVATWKNGKLRTIIEELPDEVESRFNDVFADSAGRVFCGTMPTKNRHGHLYRLDRDGSIRRVLQGISCSNGMALTLDRKGLYYTDSEAYEIYLFDYDEATGELSNQRIFVKHGEEDGLPDGMTVDAHGNVWSAHWGGSCLIRYDRSGNEIMRIPFPVRRVSSVIFGGDDYSDMYVTTANSVISEGANKAVEGELAGALFRLRIPGVRGLPEYYSRILL
jgi:D-xylonolactonase